MSEPRVEKVSPQPSAVPSEAEEEISWEDAMEDLEKQKQMIQASQKAATATRAAEKPQTGHGELENHLLDADEGLRSPNLRFLLDIPLQVTVELGRKRLVVHDLLQLNQGSVIELTKQIGEPFEVLVNQKLIARGEVVVINDKFGVRITDIISPTERVQQLQ
jgi:flagellar motor switch protein FliN/FliY